MNMTKNHMSCHKLNRKRRHSQSMDSIVRKSGNTQGIIINHNYKLNPRVVIIMVREWEAGDEDHITKEGQAVTFIKIIIGVE